MTSTSVYINGIGFLPEEIANDPEMMQEIRRIKDDPAVQLLDPLFFHSLITKRIEAIKKNRLAIQTHKRFVKISRIPDLQRGIYNRLRRLCASNNTQ